MQTNSPFNPQTELTVQVKNDKAIKTADKLKTDFFNATYVNEMEELGYQIKLPDNLTSQPADPKTPELLGEEIPENEKTWLDERIENSKLIKWAYNGEAALINAGLKAGKFGLNVAGDVFERGNKFLSNTVIPTKFLARLGRKGIDGTLLMTKLIARMGNQWRGKDESEEDYIKRFNSVVDSLMEDEDAGLGIMWADAFTDSIHGMKALIPFTDHSDTESFGQVMGKEWYEPLVGEKAPWWYELSNDLSFETLAMSGVSQVSKLMASTAEVPITKSPTVEALFSAEDAKVATEALSDTVGSKLLTKYPELVTEVAAQLKKGKGLNADLVAKRLIAAEEKRLMKLATVANNNLSQKTIVALNKKNPRLLEEVVVETEVRQNVVKAMRNDIGLREKIDAQDKIVKKLTNVLQKATSQREDVDALNKIEKGRRTTKAAEAASEVATRSGKVEDALTGPKTLSKLKGEYKPATFTSDATELLTDSEWETLFKVIDEHPITNAYAGKFVPVAEGGFSWTKFNAAKALGKLKNNEIPQPAELDLLSELFGYGLVKPIIEMQLSKGQKATKILSNILGVPRAMMVMGEMSATLRQGGMAAAAHPKAFIKAFVESARAAMPGRRGVKYARLIEENKFLRQNYGAYRRSGLFLPKIIDGGTSEEIFSGVRNLVEHIPVIGKLEGWSERTYLAFTNELRMNMFDVIYNGTKGAALTDKELTSLARYVNAFTGRGVMPDNKFGQFLSQLFFAPRLAVSRLQVPASVLLESAPIRKVAAKDLAKYYSAVAGILGTAYYLGYDVELNPKSADFGKIKVGNTRFDILSGNGPMIRALARTAAGQTKTGTDDIRDISRMDILLRFVRSKFSPVAALGVDVLSGESMMGDEVSTRPSTISRMAYENLTPLFAQDVIDYIRVDGSLDKPGTFGSVLAGGFVGLGISTYETEYGQIFEMYDNASKELYRKSYYDLSYEESMVVDNAVKIAHNEELDDLTRRARAKHDGIRSGGYIVDKKHSVRRITGYLNKANRSIIEETKAIIPPAPTKIRGVIMQNRKEREEYERKFAKNLNGYLNNFKETLKLDDKLRRQMVVDKAIKLATKETIIDIISKKEGRD